MWRRNHREQARQRWLIRAPVVNRYRAFSRVSTDDPPEGSAPGLQIESLDDRDPPGHPDFLKAYFRSREAGGGTTMKRPAIYNYTHDRLRTRAFVFVIILNVI